MKYMDIASISNQAGQGSNNDPNVQNLMDATKKINQDFKEKAASDTAKSSGGKYTYIDIARTPINPDLFFLVDVKQAESALIIPFFRLGRKLRVAVADPQNIETQKELKKLEDDDYELVISLATPEGIKQALTQFHHAQDAVKTPIDSNIEEDLEAYQLELSNISKLVAEIEPSNIKDGLYKILLSSMKTHASDLHFQPEAKKTILRFRIDGILQNVAELKPEIYKQITQQIKYDAGLKLNVYEIPQDGRLSFKVNERNVDVRISTIPTEFGETIVMRILDSGKKFATFEELGFSEEHLNILKEISDLAQGMILVTGPTGSGKTTTLYSMLNVYNTPEKKIITLEDPIEYHLERIVQSQIDIKKGYDFSKGLNSILRQDPDVVMIGEIRNTETANTALQAALTGHVLLSTLHTNSALESIPRLINMGLEPFMIAPALDTIMAQRLVRTFCPHCVNKQIVSATDKEYLTSKILEIQKITGKSYDIPAELPVAVGCEKCNHTGYLGRIVIAEIFRVDAVFKEMIIKKSTAVELEQKAQSLGLINMEQDGIIKVLNGKTSLQEVKRVTN